MAGDEWAKCLSDELHLTKIFLLLLSPTWLQSEECQKEYATFRVAMAKDSTKRLLPLLWSPVDKRAINQNEASIFTELQTYQAFNWSGIQYYDQSSEHVRLQFALLADTITTLLLSGRVAPSASRSLPVATTAPTSVTSRARAVELGTIAALAIGAFVMGRLSVGAHLGVLRIDELEVGRLRLDSRSSMRLPR
jgi:hypothetical protein